MTYYYCVQFTLVYLVHRKVYNLMLESNSPKRPFNYANHLENYDLEGNGLVVKHRYKCKLLQIRMIEREEKYTI